MDDPSTDDPEKFAQLEQLGCFVNEDWEVRRGDDPDEKLTWKTPLEYDQLVCKKKGSLYDIDSSSGTC